jgi:predicted MFS family arabinose efflux permease
MSNKLYRRYVLGVLTLVFALNFLDRNLLSLLLQPIKEDLNLSDTQLGFLTGISFAMFYAALGLPIARWADRGNRVTITSVAIAVWGVTVMSCLFVTNFAQLMLARIAAGVGESGCMPPTYSLVGDYFPAPGSRTRAMAIYMMAGPLSALISFIAGGWLSEIYGWRITFFVAGIPGLLVACLVKMTISEPRMQVNHLLGGPQRRFLHISDLIRTLWDQKSSRHLIVAIILIFTMGFGMNPWYAAFMMRSHGMRTAEVGVWLGLIFGIGGVAGNVLGGYVAGRWFAHDEQRQMRWSAVMIASLVPFFVLFLFLPEKHQALAVLLPLLVVFNFFLGPTFALMQRLVVDEMRATTLALVMLLANLIGMGIGPQLVGLLSDLLMPALGVDSLRYAMLAVSFVALWAAYHFWQVGRTVKEDLVEVARSAEAGVNSVDGYARKVPMLTTLK